MNKPMSKERLQKMGIICSVYSVFALLLSVVAFGGHNPIWVVVPAFFATLTFIPAGLVALLCLIASVFAKP